MSAPAESTRGKGVRWTRAKDGARMRSTTVHLPIALHKQLALHCAERDRKLSEVIAGLVAEMLGPAPTPECRECGGPITVRLRK